MPGSPEISARYREAHPDRVRQSQAEHYLRNAERYKAAQRQRRRLRTEEENRLRAIQDRSTPKGFLTGIVAAAKARAVKKDLEFDLTRDALLDLYQQQEGLCAITGLQMTTLPGQGRIRTNVSLDRIDSTRGYTIDNVQLVCDLINTMKQNLSMDEFVDLCRLVVEGQED